MPWLHVRTTETNDDNEEMYINLDQVEAFLEDGEHTVIAMPRGTIRVAEDLHDVHRRVVAAERRSAGLELLDIASVS
ncbi:MAG TPA: hypothetical protein VM537_29650 [Anaerolineae bacterium]|nr:hypothetical protein [Anaerolineae bacterium]